ncbi:hypothetical protein C791_5627 [Amycolatopsis azurea DSM 43854]|uniref:Uncharacterized protein n=1 Tax=Amycolatopsis azurea DSM 43854 TaxID=1238180 RepID=M2QEZ4_9PSEU|nr:hypothetical protein C791_5627 [Amycolatopsis azurea DSM 43854]
MAETAPRSVRTHEPSPRTSVCRRTRSVRVLDLAKAIPP